MPSMTSVSPVFYIVLSYSIIACSSAWDAYNGYEYHFEIKDAYDTWYRGRQWCLNNGGDLASILTEGESNFILSKVGFSRLWIGLYSLEDQQTWTWSDGNDLHIQDWKATFPTRPEDTVEYHLCGDLQNGSEEGSWRNDHCDTLRGFVCKRIQGDSGPITDAPTPTVGGYCPTGYFNFDTNDNKCYRIIAVDHVTEGVTRQEARANCRAGPGHLPDLVSIHSHYENAILTSQLTKATRNFFIGLKRFNTAWLWSDNSDYNYNNWGKETTAEGDCTALRALVKPGEWVQEGCESTLGYICQTYKSEFISNPHYTTPHPCPPSYTPYWYACYMVTDTTYTWQDARKHCQNSYTGADLVSIHSATENAAVYADLHVKTGQAWIGLNDVEHTGGYNWTDGWSVLHTEWGQNEPSENSTGGCVSLHEDGKWYDDICGEQKKAFCKYTTESPITPPSIPAGVCPDEVDGATEWEKYHKYCYYFNIKESMTWVTARAKCMEIGGPTAHLASIHDIQENRFIQSHVLNAPIDVWIGLIQHLDDTFTWIDGSPIEFQRWAPGRPTSLGQRCVEFYVANDVAGFWNDHYCDHERGFVCKTEQLPPPDNVYSPDSCRENWHGHGDSCYFFEPNTITTWDLAQKHCSDIDGKANLASIDGVIGSNWIQSKVEELNNMPDLHSYWIGLYKTGPMVGGNHFQWIDDNEVNYLRWDTEEPSDTYGSENCVQANPVTGLWSTSSCSAYAGYVCKMPRETSGGLSGGQIAGIVIGVLLGVALIVVALFMANRMGYIKKPSMNSNKFNEFTNSSSEPTPQSSRRGNLSTDHHSEEASA